MPEMVSGLSSQGFIQDGREYLLETDRMFKSLMLS